jgi:predicted ATPase
LTALVDHLEGLARKRPVLFVFEDVHWAEASSLELLDLAMGRFPSLPILAIITFRPEFELPWSAIPNVTTLPLGRLDRVQVRAMVDRVAQEWALPLK